MEKNKKISKKEEYAKQRLAASPLRLAPREPPRIENSLKNYIKKVEELVDSL